MTSAEPGPATTPPNPERINSPVRIRLLKYPVPPNRLLGGVSLVLGLLTVAWPLGWAPAWTYALASLGAVAALAAVFLRWRRGPVLAVAAAIISSAVSHAGIPVLAAEGLFILAYLSPAVLIYAVFVVWPLTQAFAFSAIFPRLSKVRKTQQVLEAIV